MKQLLRSSILLCTLLIASFGVMAQLNVSVTVDRHISCPCGDDAQITVNISGAGNGTVVVEWRESNRALKDIILVDGPTAAIKFPRDGKKNTPIPSGDIEIKIVDLSDTPTILSETVSVSVYSPHSPNFSINQPTSNVSKGSISLTLPFNNDIYSYDYSIDGGETYISPSDSIKLSSGSYKLLTRILSVNTQCVLEDDIIIGVD